MDSNCFYWPNSSCTHTQRVPSIVPVVLECNTASFLSTYVQCECAISIYVLVWPGNTTSYDITYEHITQGARAATEYAQIYPNTTTRKKYYSAIPSRAPGCALSHLCESAWPDVTTSDLPPSVISGRPTSHQVRSSFHWDSWSVGSHKKSQKSHRSVSPMLNANSARHQWGCQHSNTSIMSTNYYIGYL